MFHALHRVLLKKYVFFLLLVVLGFELRSSHLQVLYHFSHSASPVFVLGFLR
jgi:hypothetical protein